MQFEEITAIIGKAINDPAVTAFVNKYKYDSFEKLSGFDSVRDHVHWLDSFENGPTLEFNLKVFNPSYQAQREEKGEFYPILTMANFSSPDCCRIDFPFDINLKNSYDDLVKKLGEPTQKSSEYALIYLKDGEETFCDWQLPLNNDHVFFVEYDLEFKAVTRISVKLKEHRCVFDLYDTNFETFEQTYHNIRISVLYFMRWAIENHFITETENNKALLREIREGKTTVAEYLRSLERGYVAEHDFNVQRVFIRQYIHALMDTSIRYYNDFVRLFVTDKELLNNPFSKEAQGFLDAYDWNEEAYRKVKSMISKRLAEFDSRQK